MGRTERITMRAAINFRSLNSKPFARTLVLHLLEQPDQRRSAAGSSPAICWLLRARDSARDGQACSYPSLDAASRLLSSCATTSSHLQVHSQRHSPASRSPRQPAPSSHTRSAYMLLSRPRRRYNLGVTYGHWRAGRVDVGSVAIAIALLVCGTGSCRIKRRPP